MPRVELKFDGVSRGAVLAANQTKSAIRGVSNEADHGSKRLNIFERALRYGVTRAMYATAAGTVALGGGVAFLGIRFDDLKQRANIAFTTMLGSGKKAHVFLQQLQQFANKTPFEFQDLIRASQRMLGMGVAAKQVIPTLTAVGNAVAGIGGSAAEIDIAVRAIGQIQAKGRLMAEEMMQLNEAGVFSWRDLAREIGVSVPKAMQLVQNGAVSSDAFLAAFQASSMHRFNGMMEQQSHTFGGLLSTVKDLFTQMAGTAMKPLFDLAQRGMERMVNDNGKLNAAGQRAAHIFGVELAAAVEKVVGFFREHWDQIVAFIRGAWEAGTFFANALEAIAGWLDVVIGKTIGWEDAAKFLMAGILIGQVLKLARAFRTLAGMEGIAAATGALSGKTGLLGAMARLKAFGPITISIILVYEAVKKGSDWLNDLPGANFVNKRLGGDWLNRQLGFSDKTNVGKTDPKGFDRTPGRVGAGVQIPTQITSTHQTAGLAGYPAVDIKTTIGQPILAPENGTLTRRHLIPYRPGFGGWTCYFVGHETGNTYFMTHLGSMGPEGTYRRGAIIGYGGKKVGGMEHVHVGIHPGTATPDASSLVDTSATGSGKGKGTKAPTLIGVRGQIDAMLRDLPKGLSEAGQSAAKHLRALRASLHVGMSASDLAKTRVAIQKWGKVLADEIGKAKTAAAKAAREAADAAALALERRFGESQRGVERIFDHQTDVYVSSFNKATQARVSEMQKGFSGVLKDMRKSFETEMRAFDAETQRGLAALASPRQTGAEAALSSFQEARQAADRQRAYQDALASAQTPEERAQVESEFALDQQEKALEEAARQSREAADSAATAAQDRYRDQRELLKEALSEQEQVREDAAQEAFDLQVTAYEEQRTEELRQWGERRDEQRIKLEEDLEDWRTWIAAKKKTWAEFLKWIASRGFAVPADWFSGVDDDVIQRKIFGISASDIALQRPPAGVTGAAAAGGKVPGSYVGQRDTVLWKVTPGERYISAEQEAWLERMAGGGGGGASYGPIFVLGTTSREVERALARVTGPALNRRISYRSP